ncbi:uncharacterized protein MELLADRAFT_93083 [Melampsora larici-populina 98AG31]|uniref:Uncharacterized protein n=1 Tax=Melampsora larici-populina (strain 98AG31 / pathotype 3-4-7) TaxID=747676 RepID=F4S3W4_MELLP|nr:uncharacterized protein MELLADRAFT_93083 [Melampsora larici-populina 98AG31]EGG00670.1 hypothetical protein MELLADRAFT_93083 [Melampsora larici-populina 98AG31]
MIEKLLSKLEDLTINTTANPTASTSQPAPTKKLTPQKAVNISTATPVKGPSRAVSEPPPSLSRTKSTTCASKPSSTNPPRRRPHQVFSTKHPLGHRKNEDTFQIHI